MVEVRDVNFSIDDSVDTNIKHASVVDRYYTKLFKRDVKGKIGEDQCVLVHSNRVVLITLAPSHPILSQNKQVTKVNFKVTEKTDRLNNEITGKFKRGAQQLTELSPLCHVECEDGSTYTLVGCLTSSLIEANEKLVNKPSLLNTHPLSRGFIAIVLPRLKDFEKTMAKFETEEQYNKALSLSCCGNETSS